jgi:hypothetical protein
MVNEEDDFMSSTEKKQRISTGDGEGEVYIVASKCPQKSKLKQSEHTNVPPINEQITNEGKKTG